MKAFIIIVLLAIVGYAGYLGFQSRQSAAWNNEAVQLIDEGRYSEAAAVLERARANDPHNIAVLKNLAEAYDQLGDVEKAIPVYRDLIEHAPEAPSGARERLEQLEQEDGALERARLRVERMKAEGWQDDDTSIEQTLAAAEASWHTGNWQHALMLYERALFKDPEDTSILLRIEEIEQGLRDGTLK